MENKEELSHSNVVRPLAFDVKPKIGQMPGLKFMPTLEPQLDDSQEYIPGETKYWTEIIPQHFSTENEEVLADCLRSLPTDNCVLHLGPASEQQGSSFSSIMKLKKPETRVLSTFSVASEHCAESPSMPLQQVVDWLRWFGQDCFGLIILDCHHSLNKCLQSWEITKLLDTGGVLLLHDTNHHPGPKALYKAVDEEAYDKQQHCTDPDDWGISSFRKK